MSGDVGLAANVGTGVAPALSSALNVMAFTQEMDLTTGIKHLSIIPFGYNNDVNVYLTIWCRLKAL